MSAAERTKTDAAALSSIERLRMLSATAPVIQMDAQCAREIVALVGRLESDRSQLLDRADHLTIQRDELREAGLRRDFRRAIIDTAGWISSAVWIGLYVLTWVVA